MIIRDLYSFRPVIGPYKAYPILLVDPNAVLALAVVFQSLQAIPRWEPKGLQADHGVELIEFPLRHAPDLLGARASSFLTSEPG